MRIDGVTVCMEGLRKELEKSFYPAFGMPLDIASMVDPLSPPQEGDPRLHEVPPAFQDFHHPKLMQQHWERMLSLVREPVREIRTSQGFRVLQVLGQSVLLFLPGGQLLAWLWESSPEKGMHLRRLPHDAVPLWGRFLEDGWLIRLAKFAAIEVRHFIGLNSGLAAAYCDWVFEIFAKGIAAHADIAWMRTRVIHRLALRREVVELAEQTLSPLSWPASVTVAQYNRVLRQFTTLKAVRKDIPDLFGIFEVLSTYSGFPSEGEPMQRLRRFLKARGLTQSGWNMVLSLQASDLVLFYDTFAGDVQVELLRYIALLDALELHRERPGRLVQTILRSPNQHRGLRQVAAPDVFVLNARHVVRLCLESVALLSVDRLPELNLIMDWLGSVQTPLTRAQRQAGFQWLLRQAQEWKAKEELRLKALTQPWPTPFQTIHAGSYLIRAIADPMGLYAEGSAMNHCVGSYADRCARGESLVCSVLRDGRHIATAEYKRNGAEWVLREARGPRNSTLAPDVEQTLSNAAKDFGTIRNRVVASYEDLERS